MICICTRLHAFASLGGVFFSLLSLKYYILFFLFSPCSRPSCRVPLRASPLVSSTLQTRGHPCPSLLPSCLPSACPPLLLPCVVWCVPFRLPVPVACSVLSSVCSSHRARPEALRRPAVLSPLSGCPLVAAVTRPPSGAKRCDSVGRCTAYISPA